MMKIKDQDRNLFNDWYKIHMDNLKADILLFQESQLEVMDEHDFQTTIDFKDFAFQSLLHCVKKWHNDKHNSRILMKEVRELLEPDEE